MSRRQRTVVRGRQGWPLVITGVIFFVVGLAITVVTYSNASGGGTYIVSWGPMLFGVISIVRGLIGVSRGSGGSIGPSGPYSGGAYGQVPGGPAQGYGPPAAGGYGAPAAGGFGTPAPAFGAQQGFAAQGPGFGSQPQQGFGAAGPAFGNQQGFGAATPGVPPQQGPNWFPDPQNASQLRWWDGQAWTQHTQPRA